MDGVRLVGADLSEEMMAWCRGNIPGAEFHSNGYEPPLTFLKENTIDFAFAASVFTHIPLETQQQWIREMHRVLRPGGYFLCDVLGRNHQELMLSPADMARLRSEGRLVLTADDEQASLSTKIHKSWDVFQTRSQFLQAFGSVFRILDYVPTSIDLLVLQKPLP
jgi:ubiquinone/menaquinone biosynthesis C-methylase UbiE